MKVILKKSLFIFLFLLTPLSLAQDIQILTYGLTKYEPAGTYEIVIDFEVINISQVEQTVFEVRTLDSLPSGWTSSLCIGEFCFSSETDSIATTPPLFTPLQPDDTLATSVHVFTDTLNNPTGTAYIQIEVGTFSNPEVRYPLNFMITTDPSMGVNEPALLSNYSLSQNYPNPFNPSTKINYNVAEPGFVQLKVYNVLGVEVVSLVNEQKYAGNYTVDFDASRFSSGVYFYSLTVNNFTQTRKMILEK